MYENGFVIVLDDFGIGYLGFFYFYDLYIDYIKIDYSFVGCVYVDLELIWILDCVLDLVCKFLISIVVEGVEMKE